MKATSRFELEDKGFAVLCLTTWLCETLDMQAVNTKAQIGPMTMKEIKFIVLFVTMVFLCSTEKIHGISTPICASVM